MQLLLLLCTILSLAFSGTMANPLLNRASGATQVWVTVTITVTPQATPTLKRPEEAKNAHGPGETKKPFQYTQAMLDAHNEHRSNHSAPKLKWSDELEAIAQEHSETCYYAHNTEIGGGGYGQNIGAGSTPEQSPAMISNLMYNGEFDFYPGYDGEPDLDNFEKWGHFSQILWKDTEEVGCATVHCPGGLGNTGNDILPWFLVCNYKPTGNIVGTFRKNVLKPQGRDPIVL